MPQTARSYARSSSFQMAILFTILCGAAVFILGYFSYYFNRGHFVHVTETVIDTEIRHIKDDTSTDNIVRSLSAEGRVFLLLSKDEDKLAGNLNGLPSSLSLLAEGTIVFDLDDKKYAAKIYTYPDGRKLLVGIDITQINEEYSFMQWLSMLSIGFMLLVILTSYLISRFVVQNTNMIASTAYKIMETGDLSQRIELKSSWDDLSYMADVLNQFLSKIEVLMQGIRQVSDNIAHDLRTPLTRLRNRLEDLEASAEDENTKLNFEKLISDTDQILNTFNALLRISRIETGQQHSAFSECDITALIQDAVALYEPVAEDKQISLTMDIPEDTTVLTGDRDLLFQAFANIIDNALKYTEAGGAVKVEIAAQDEGIKICVSDNGPGVPEDERDKIFDRFYRAERSRSKPGNGLGLSLVAAVVELHKGRIQLEGNKPGLRVIVTL